MSQTTLPYKSWARDRSLSTDDLDMFLEEGVGDGSSDDKARLVPLIALVAEETDEGVVDRLRYDYDSLAALGSSLGSTERDGDSGDISTRLKGRSMQCLGVWGSRSDIADFLKEKHGGTHVGVRAVSTMPAGIYCCMSPTPPAPCVTPAAAVESGNLPAEALRYLTLVMVPHTVQPSEESSTISPAAASSPAALRSFTPEVDGECERSSTNCLLLRLLCELSTRVLCLFGTISREAFRPDTFPSADDEQMPVLDLQLGRRRTRSFAEPVLSVVKGLTLSVPPGVSHVLGGSHMALVYRGAIGSGSTRRRMRSLPVTASMSTPAAWASEMRETHAVSLELLGPASRKLFMEAALPNEWHSTGLARLDAQIREVNRRVSELRTSTYEATEKVRVLRAVEAVVDSRIWQDFRVDVRDGGEVAHGPLSLADELDKLSALVGQRVASVWDRKLNVPLDVPTVEETIETRLLHQCEAAAVNELLFRGRLDSAKLTESRARYNSLEAFIEAAKREAHGVGAWSQLGFMWPWAPKVLQVSQRANDIRAAADLQAHRLRVLRCVRERALEQCKPSSKELQQAVRDVRGRRQVDLREQKEKLDSELQARMFSLAASLCKGPLLETRPIVRIQKFEEKRRAPVKNAAAAAEDAMETTNPLSPVFYHVVHDVERLQSVGAGEGGFMLRPVVLQTGTRGASPCLAPAMTISVDEERPPSVLLLRLVTDRKALAVLSDKSGDDEGGAAAVEEQPVTKVHLLDFSHRQLKRGLDDSSLVYTIKRSIVAVDLDEATGSLAMLGHDMQLALYRFNESWTFLKRLQQIDFEQALGRKAATNVHGLYFCGTSGHVVAMTADGTVFVVDVGSRDQSVRRLQEKHWNNHTQLLLSRQPPVLVAISPCHGVKDQESRLQLSAYSLTAAGPERVGSEPVMLPPDLPIDLPFAVTPLHGEVHLFWTSTQNKLSSVALHLPVSVRQQPFVVHGSSHKARPSHHNKYAASLSRSRYPGTSNDRLLLLMDAWDKFPAAEAVVEGDGGKGRVSLKAVGVLAKKGRGPAGQSSFQAYIRRILDTLHKETQVAVGGGRLSVEEHDWEDFTCGPQDGWRPAPCDEWATRLLSLVPLQIARLHQGQLRALCDGRMPAAVEGKQTVEDLASQLRFSTHEMVLQHNTTKPVQVIAAIGGQSTGKSYILNLLGGGINNTAGNRCTDGVWMSTRVLEDRVLVLLDFEGLNSFERTESEDVMLGVLAAAVADVTIFRCHYFMDRYTQQTFSRLASAAHKCKAWGSSVFRGQLFMALRDVKESDRDAVAEEFQLKLEDAVTQGADQEDGDWLATLFNGSVKILALTQFQTPNFYKDMRQLRSEVLSQPPTHYSSGERFLQVLRLVLSKLEFADWTTPFEEDQAQARRAAVLEALDTALETGYEVYSHDGEASPVKLHVHDGDAIEDPSVVDLSLVVRAEEREALVKGEQLVVKRAHEVPGSNGGRWEYEVTRLQLADTGLILREDRYADLLNTFLELYPSSPDNSAVWHDNFASFIDAVVTRRIQRVSTWVRLNCEGAEEEIDEEVQARMASLQARISVCRGGTCAECLAPCNSFTGHAGTHDCCGQHTCAAACQFCSGDLSKSCGLRKGHGGAHSCGSHVCGRPCHLSTVAGGCIGDCRKVPGHTDECECGQKQHTCRGECDGTGCARPCRVAYGVAHERHECDRIGCGAMCQLCGKTCASNDHFHAGDPEFPHLCDNVHQCTGICQREGICELAAERSQQKSAGARHAVTTYKPKRLHCRRVIPVGELQHEGPCTCVSEAGPDRPHTCPSQCPQCGYYCEQEVGHEGKHMGVHGNARKSVVIMAGGGEHEEVSTEEASLQQSCEELCRSLGRGHVHLTPCRCGSTAPPAATGSPVVAGVARADLKWSMLSTPSIRHAPKDAYMGMQRGRWDQVKHSAYCELSGWEDWCKDGRIDFELCSFACCHPEHNAKPSMTHDSSDAAMSSHCMLPLWHEPLDPRGPLPEGAPVGATISRAGHLFACSHARRSGTTPTEVHTDARIPSRTTGNMAAISPCGKRARDLDEDESEEEDEDDDEQDDEEESEEESRNMEEVGEADVGVRETRSVVAEKSRRTDKGAGGARGLFDFITKPFKERFHFAKKARL